MNFRSCPHCGSQRSVQESFCGFCGKALPYVAEQDKPGPPPPIQQPPPQQQSQIPAPVSDLIYRPGYSTTSAMICSLFIVGLGQIINGQVGKGLVMFVAAIIVAPFTLYIGMVAIWVLAIVDTAMIGARLKNGQSVTPWQFF